MLNEKIGKENRKKKDKEGVGGEVVWGDKC